MIRNAPSRLRILLSLGLVGAASLAAACGDDESATTAGGSTGSSDAGAGGDGGERGEGGAPSGPASGTSTATGEGAAGDGGSGAGDGGSGGGAGGGGALQCELGSADCNGDAADGCETDLLNDGEHCGRCDLACIASTCDAGECEVAFDATGVVYNIDDLVVDDDHIYVLGDITDEDGTWLARVEKDGSNLEPIQVGLQPYSLEDGGDAVFYVDNVDDACVVYGAAKEEVEVYEVDVATDTYVTEIAADGDRLLIARNDDYTLATVAHDGSDREELPPPGGNVCDLASGAEHWYASSCGSKAFVERYDKTGGPPEGFAPLDRVSEMVESGGYLYAASYGLSNDTDCDTNYGWVRRVNLEDGTEESFVENVSRVSGLVVDGDDIYYTTCRQTPDNVDTRTVWHVSPGGVPTIVLDDVFYAHQLALDEQYLYVPNGVLMRLER